MPIDKEYPDLYESLVQKYPQLKPEDVIGIMEICLSMCKYCGRIDPTCQCWNDE